MPSDPRVLIGLKIRKLRLALKLSQEDLAERSGTHRNYVGGVERGERNVALLNIIQIARALGVRPAALFEDIE